MNTKIAEYEQTCLDQHEENLIVNTCHYCGHTGSDVTSYGYEHVGGEGEHRFPACEDAEACIARVDNARDKKVAVPGIAQVHA